MGNAAPGTPTTPASAKTPADRPDSPPEPRPPHAQRRLRCRLRKVRARLDDLIAACDHLLDTPLPALLLGLAVAVGVPLVT